MKEIIADAIWEWLDELAIYQQSEEPFALGVDTTFSRRDIDELAAKIERRLLAENCS